MAGTQGSGELLIETEGLTKDYGTLRAVDGLSFSVRSGEVVGFLGPNGAGKSTTMRMLTTYLPPTAGTARIGGADIVDDTAKVRRSIGYMPEVPPLYEEMRVEPYLRFVAELKGLPRGERSSAVDWALDVCGVEARRRQVIGTLSKGFRQRVSIAQAILHDPRVLILDEPTAGLDPSQILELRDLIRRLGRDRTILLSTHILQEVTSVCTRVLILHEGDLVYDAPLEETGAPRTWVVRTKDDVGLPEGFEHDDVERLTADPAGEPQLVLKAEARPDAVLKALVQAEVPVQEFAPAATDLERIFIELTSRGRLARPTDPGHDDEGRAA